MSEESFSEWGWRIPFWFSVLMVLISYLIRKNMHESPAFLKLKSEGKTSANPIKESLGQAYNFKYVLLALLGATMGQGVIWYTGHYYAMHFLKTDCHVDAIQVEQMMTIAFLMATPFFVLFGWLSDVVGRKKIMLAGMLAAMFCYFPIYSKMYEVANIDEKGSIQKQTEISELRRADDSSPGDSVKIVTITSTYSDGAVFVQKETTKINASSKNSETPGVIQIQKKLGFTDRMLLILLIFIQVIFVTMVYGPIAAFLVEMFPARIRYTSMSLPYHVGNGIFGGLMPAVAAYLTTQAKGTESLPAHQEWYLQGLWYPVIIAGICFVIGLVYIDGRDKRLDD
jgi:MFS family permease